jgi:hypothetical protein
VCLSKPKDTSILRNLSILRKLRIRNVLWYRPGLYYETLPICKLQKNDKFFAKSECLLAWTNALSWMNKHPSLLQSSLIINSCFYDTGSRCFKTFSGLSYKDRFLSVCHFERWLKDLGPILLRIGIVFFIKWPLISLSGVQELNWSVAATTFSKMTLSIRTPSITSKSYNTALCCH